MRAWWVFVLTVCLGVLTPTVAVASTDASRHAPVSRSGAVVSQAPVPLTTLNPVPGTSVLTTEVFLTRWTTRLVYGQRGLLEGQVLVIDGALPEARVHLYARPVGKQRWSHIAATTTAPDAGVFRFNRFTPRSNTNYRVVYRGGLLYEGSAATKRINVARRVRDDVARHPDGGFRLHGSIAPSVTGKRVLLQRKTCGACDWKVIKRTRTSNTSRWAFRIWGPNRPATWRYRAMVPGDSRFVTSYGDHVWSITRR